MCLLYLAKKQILHYSFIFTAVGETYFFVGPNSSGRIPIFVGRNLCGGNSFFVGVKHCGAKLVGAILIFVGANQCGAKFPIVRDSLFITDSTRLKEK